MKRTIIMIMAITLMLSVMVVPVFAAEEVTPYSSKDIHYYEVARLAKTSFAQTDSGRKENHTPVWTRIDTLTNGKTVRVRVVGSSLAGHACTYDDYNLAASVDHCRYCTRCTTMGNWVPYVLCEPHVNYAISSLVYEYGYPYASLGFQSGSNMLGQEVEGWWSADSTKYNDYSKPIPN